MRVLFLTHRLPYAPDRGDRIRAFHMLRVLSGQADVHVLSLVHDPAEAARADSMRRLARAVTTVPTSRVRSYPAGARAVLVRRPLTHAFLDSPLMSAAIERILRREGTDVVLAYCSGMARFALEPPLSSLPFVLDMVDVDSRKWSALSLHARAPKRWVYKHEAACLEQFEAVASHRARATLVVNERERDALAQIAPGADIRVVGNGIDVEYFRPQNEPDRHACVVFCGVMNYEPNAEGALWLIHEVWPLVRTAVPGARLMIVGSDPRRDVRAAGEADASVTVTGRVPDVRPYLWRSAVAVAPLRTARGVQNKVLEATAAGLPSVVTPAVFDGLPREVRETCRIAGDSASFASALVEMLSMPAAERNALVAGATVEHLTWDRQLAPLVPILEEASRRR